MTVCAVDIGGTWTKIGLVDERGDVRHFSRVPTAGPADRFSALLIGQIGESVAREPGVEAIGVSVAGFIDGGRSRMTYNPNLPWLVDFPLQAALRDAFGIPVRIEVDSNAAALGEYRFGHGAGARRFLCLTIGTGVGGGFLIDGQPARFTGECIGDVGHIIVEPGGPLCTCGGRGCAEAVLTAPAILLASGTAAGSLEELAPRREMDRFFIAAGHQLGLLAASLASIFFPDCIALGGGVPAASHLVIEGVREAFERSAGDWARANTRIVQAKLGPLAPLIGAACLAGD